MHISVCTFQNGAVHSPLYKFKLWLKQKINPKNCRLRPYNWNNPPCLPLKGSSDKYINSHQIPQNNDTKYIGMHLDRKFNWQKHISTNRKHIGLIYQKLHTIMSRHSKLSIDNKLNIYCIIKPVWTYGFQLWGTSSTSYVEILRRFQSKVLCCITGGPWYVPNTEIQQDLQINNINDTIQLHSRKYRDKTYHNYLPLLSSSLLTHVLGAQNLLIWQNKPWILCVKFIFNLSGMYCWALLPCYLVSFSRTINLLLLWKLTDCKLK